MHQSNPKQREQLRLVDEMNRRCAEHHVSREMALEVLPPLVPVNSITGLHNCWWFLRGSDQPRTMTPEEAKRLLLGDAPPK
jgi:hypothetical protein